MTKLFLLGFDIRNFFFQNNRPETVLDFSDLPEERQKRYTKLLEKSKALVQDGEIKGALVKLERAYEIFNSDKIERRIAKYRAYLADKGIT